MCVQNYIPVQGFLEKYSLRLRSLVIKFEEYTKDPKHTMSEHLRVMSNMIGKLRDAGHALTDEQQVRAVIRSLPASWANMKQILTHSENIKNFSDVSQHVILEAETRDADKTLTYVAQVGSRNANGYVMYGEHPNGGRTEIESRDVDFIESDFPSIGDASKNLDLYELEDVEPTLPSSSEGGELVPRPVVAEDSVSDLQPSGSIPDSGSTPQGPLGQQDSQLRRGGAISWCSKKKSCIALSTMESEYVACSATVQEAVWLRSFIQALRVTAHIDEAVAVHCENTVALDFVKDPKYHGKAKHIGLRYHFIRALVAQGEVSMKHIPTGRMVADPLTKPIARDVFLSHIRSMGLRRDIASTPSIIAWSMAATRNPLLNARAPISFLLQREALKSVPFSHVPFHLPGIGDIPLSLKLSLSGQIPVSNNPMITSLPDRRDERLPSPSGSASNPSKCRKYNSFKALSCSSWTGRDLSIGHPLRVKDSRDETQAPLEEEEFLRDLRPCTSGNAFNLGQAVTEKSSRDESACSPSGNELSSLKPPIFSFRRDARRSVSGKTLNSWMPSIHKLSRETRDSNPFGKHEQKVNLPVSDLIKAADSLTEPLAMPAVYLSCFCAGAEIGDKGPLMSSAKWQVPAALLSLEMPSTVEIAQPLVLSCVAIGPETSEKLVPALDGKAGKRKHNDIVEEEEMWLHIGLVTEIIPWLRRLLTTGEEFGWKMMKLWILCSILGASRADFELPKSDAFFTGIRKAFGNRFDAPIILPSWLSEEDLPNYYASKFEHTGFTGGVNYYRAFYL
ncbi:hypothetical protein RJ640_000876 [Escallonia rubra]|uniref:Uncharacterized protein n=1 Tax=Escallonia rubra TaxID=112253 RepID=A0AA88QUC5_9ASTE|nr:hypothetical protein RJ640_000876 [Escallonia rubra]